METIIFTTLLIGWDIRNQQIFDSKIIKNPPCKPSMFCVASNSRVASNAYIEAVLVVVAIVVIVVAVIGVSSNGSMGLRP